MGYTGVNKPSMTTKEFFEKEFGYNSCKLLDCKTKGSVAYIALEMFINKERIVTAVVCLIKRSKDYYYNFTYKVIYETMMPYYYDCPLSIIKLLTPTINENANKWRDLCRERIKTAKTIKIKKGDTVVFEQDFRFSGNRTANTFIRDHETKNHYWCPSIGMLVRLTKKNFINNKYTVTKVN